LTVDGGLAYSDRQRAQNTADSAAFAAALAYGRNRDMTAVAQAVTTANNYDNNGTSNQVSVTVLDSPSDVCPDDAPGKDITVQITSIVDTNFGPAVGIQSITNVVAATTRACGSYIAPLFDGNAIVSLAPSGKGFEAAGTPDWIVKGGGIFSNSSSCPSVNRSGSADLTVESGYGISTPGCVSGVSGIPISQGSDVPQVTWDEYKSLLPPTPDCDGTAYESGGTWFPESGKFGSKVAFSGDMNFATGLYCVTNSPGSFHGAITGEHVTFYVSNPNFSMKFNGGGNLTATALEVGPYAGVLMYLAPQVDSNGTLLNTQAIDMRGNGSGEIVGTILAPSADVTMFGNSGTSGFQSQIVAYQIDSGGTADQFINYKGGDNYLVAMPVKLFLLK
jgi:hypothetical protein